MSSTTPSVLIIAPHGSYRTFPFIHAAQQHNIHTLIASEGKHSIVSAYAEGIHVDFSDEERAYQEILAAISDKQVVSVVATDDMTTELAARIAKALKLPHNEPAAVHLTRRKDRARDCLQKHGVNKPAHRRLDLHAEIKAQLDAVIYPVVIKPIGLSASRGVIRADDEGTLLVAIERVRALLDSLTDLSEEERRYLLLEEYIPGVEIAVEGMLREGQLNILTIFDKPDPLEGPFFEETYYITPTGLSIEVQQQVRAEIQAACDAYGLREGPIHAECRLNECGVFVLEVAARTIGGMCGRLLSFGTGHSLEELVLLHAMGKAINLTSTQGAAGVLMIPIPKAGMLKRVEGLLQAQRIPFIDEINIQIREGHELIPLPEGSSYLGFIFAKAPDARQAEQALREAHRHLNFIISPVWKLTQGNPACLAQ